MSGIAPCARRLAIALTTAATLGAVCTAVAVVTATASSAATTSVLYFSSAAAPTLSGANQLATTVPSAIRAEYNDTDRQTGWVELRSGGRSPAAKTTLSRPSPSGHGYLWSASALDGKTVSAGSWQPTLTLQGNGTLRVVPVARFYKRSASGTQYALIGSSTGVAMSLGATRATVQLPPVTAPAVPFATGERLYVDLLADVLSAACCTGDGVIHFDNGGAGEKLAFPAITTSPSPTPTPSASPTPTPTPTGGGIWHPAPGTTWQWQITGTVDQTLPVQMYDIDLFDAQPAAASYAVPGFGTVDVPRGDNAGVIATLHAAGKVVVCYLDTGAWESYRPDQALFPTDVRGSTTGWSGERWLDIRQPSWGRFEALIVARLDLARRSGCDGVEPDQNNPIGNSPGFPISLADQKAWYLEVARLAHARNLSVGQKNGIETTDADTVAAFDWNLNEECRLYTECTALDAFVAAGKAVFHVEYTDEGMTSSQFCAQDNAAHFDGLVKHLDLGVWREACR